MLKSGCAIAIHHPVSQGESGPAPASLSALHSGNFSGAACTVLLARATLAQNANNIRKGFIVARIKISTEIEPDQEHCITRSLRDSDKDRFD